MLNKIMKAYEKVIKPQMEEVKDAQETLKQQTTDLGKHLGVEETKKLKVITSRDLEETKT